MYCTCTHVIVGCLVVKNKTLEQKWTSKKLRQTIRKQTIPTTAPNTDIQVIEVMV